jgi:hypothetical protein
VEVQVHQGEVGAQPVMVLRDASVSHLVEAEDPLQDAEHKGTSQRQLTNNVIRWLGAICEGRVADSMPTRKVASGLQAARKTAVISA